MRQRCTQYNSTLHYLRESGHMQHLLKQFPLQDLKRKENEFACSQR